MKEISADELMKLIQLSTCIYEGNDRIDGFEKALMRTINKLKSEHYTLDDIIKPLLELVDKKQIVMGWDILLKQKFIIFNDTLDKNAEHHTYILDRDPANIKRFFKLER